jgi:hypothetical protein
MIKSQNSLFYVRRNKLEACPTFHKIKCASVYVGAEAFVKFEAIVADGDRKLADTGKPALEEKVGKGGLIDRFKQPGTEVLMELHCGIDDNFADFVFGHYGGFD